MPCICYYIFELQDQVNLNYYCTLDKAYYVDFLIFFILCCSFLVNQLSADISINNIILFMHDSYLIKGFTLLDRQQNHVIEEILDKKAQSTVQKAVDKIKINQRNESYHEITNESFQIISSNLDKQQGTDSSYIGVLITDPQFPKQRAQNLLDEILIMIKKNGLKALKDQDKLQILQIEIALTLIHWNDSNKHDLDLKDERMRQLNKILLIVGAITFITTIALGIYIVYH